MCVHMHLCVCVCVAGKGFTCLLQWLHVRDVSTLGNLCKYGLLQSTQVVHHYIILSETNLKVNVRGLNQIFHTKRITNYRLLKGCVCR